MSSAMILCSDVSLKNLHFLKLGSFLSEIKDRSTLSEIILLHVSDVMTLVISTFVWLGNSTHTTQCKVLKLNRVTVICEQPFYKVVFEMWYVSRLYKFFY